MPNPLGEGFRLRGDVAVTHGVVAVKSLIGLSFSALVMQTAVNTVPDVSPFVTPVEHLTVVAVLAIAVRVLWNAMREKDARIVEMTTKVTEVMTTVIDAVKEMRKSSDELGVAVDNLSSNVAAWELAVHNKNKENRL